MSSVVVEPAPTSAQLYFSFGEDPVADELCLEEARESQATPALQAEVPGLHDGVWASKQVSPSAIANEGQRRSGHRTHESRFGEPIQIGSAMLQLLRQYGITEAEIEDGMRKYSARQNICAA